ncbi:hypothetical protein V8C42DRAFT_173272 [Trichoderma barbatum]
MMSCLLRLGGVAGVAAHELNCNAGIEDLFSRCPFLCHQRGIGFVQYLILYFLPSLFFIIPDFSSLFYPSSSSSLDTKNAYIAIPYHSCCSTPGQCRYPPAIDNTSLLPSLSGEASGFRGGGVWEGRVGHGMQLDFPVSAGSWVFNPCLDF